MSGIVRSDAVVGALIAAGVLKNERLRRVVIDLQAGHVAMIYTENFADEALLEVTPLLAGAEIRRGGT